MPVHLLVAAAMLVVPGNPATLASRVDSAITAQVRAGFSGAVLIAHGDSVILERSYGSAAAAAPSPGGAAFWLASDSKQFTAVAILRLQDTGRLRVSDSIGAFFPGVPADKRSITLHHLLTHTSGLPHAYKADGIVDRDRAVAEILRLKLGSRPGERYSYSNDGYSLLAAVVDLASGVGFDAYLRDSLLARAGMSHSGVWGQEQAGVAIAAAADPGRTRRQRPTVFRDGHSVGNWGYRGPTGAYASTRDIHRWIQALRRGTILSREGMAALLGRHVLVRGDSTGQSYGGYGWGVRVEQGKDVSYGHSGNEDWLGHNAVIRFEPGGRIVAVLSNAGDIDGSGWSTRVNRAIRQIMDPPR